MKIEKQEKEQKRRQHQFSLVIFFIAFLIFGAFTTIQMQILQNYINYEAVPISIVAVIFVFWMLLAIAFTLLTRYQISIRYERPMRQFAKATRQVANGDFSVYLKPPHMSKKRDYIDYMFLDFNKMVEDLGSIETLKTDFFSSVSHEIKTPLAIIQNYAELLQNEDLNPVLRLDYVTSIHQATKRLSNLISNMLKLNKLEKQIIQTASEPYDVCAQICECALLFENLWESKNIEFEADLEDAATIEADESLMELVWNNLLSNALKFTEPGGTITIKQISENEEVIIEISDSGCGINEKTLKHIFEKFYQGDTSHATEGNGLGLALVYRVIQLMNGLILAESDVGKGTTFTVHLPAGKSQEEVAHYE